jgi:cell division protein FtsA
MAKVYTERLIVSIDVGTTKICVLIAQHVGNNQLEILGVGKAPSDGLKKGVVVDIAKTIQAIKNAVKEAELMADVKIESAAIGVSGGHIQSLASQGMVPIKKGEVREVDMQAAIDAAKAIPIPEGMQILHVLPQYFVIDGRTKVQDPLGMHGIRLEVQAHIILGAIASVQNLVKCCEMAGVKVSDIILEQLASADAVLSDDERELGVAVLDIGGGTSDLALYQNGSIRHTYVLPVAGTHFTQDIAIGLRTSLVDAERIKKEYGLASLAALTQDTIFEVDAVHGTEKKLVQQTELVAIIQPRAQELLSLIHEEIIKHHVQPYMATGLVLTGGGSLLAGMQPLAQDIFGCPVRVGAPKLSHAMPESLENPMYATGYGLLVHVLKKSSHNTIESLSGPMMQRVFMRMKSWVADFF